MTSVQKLAGLVLLALVLMAGTAVATWEVQAWRLGKQLAEQLTEQGAAHQKHLDAITSEAWRQQQAEQDKRLATERQLATQDQQLTKELSDAQRNQTRVRDQLATTELRLSVLLTATDSASGCNVPTAPGAAGVVHAARRAQLDPAHAQRIIAITDDGDNAVIALRACQAYAKALSAGG
ncbi:lysis system i-spanin subunit Rz [Pseudomonas sp. 2995-3]|uniref:lysis system i-spanin subunit Rz n=1 Tax=Pseudomonas sp. 2995-3 TaxID=1712680 RepID=UPI000C157341|nr:lysis system i-spanin subunit Rz [Pseudomonas sp. 2995-3]PIB69514.1 lysozyme [Pseudomonas sp. 2995-3]